MYKKLFASRIMKILSIIIIIGILVGIFQVRYDENQLRVDGFYLEPKNSLDVVFIGASEVFTGFSAGLAYEKYGFTSYPLCVNNSPAAAVKYEIIEILKHQSPKMIIIEINSFIKTDDDADLEDARYRNLVDDLPFSANKIHLLFNTYHKDDPETYIFPFIKYHGLQINMPGLADTIKMKLRGYSFLRGNTTQIDMEDVGKTMNVIGDSSKINLSDSSEKILNDLLDYLVKHDIKNVVFMRMPHKITDTTLYKRYCRGNKIEEMIKNKGFDVLNFEENPEELSIDFETDFYNNDHLNIYGQQKFTEYLGELIQNRYNVAGGTKSPKVTESWENTVKYTHLFYSYVDDKIKSGASGQVCENNALIKSLDSLPNQNPRATDF